MDLQNQILSNDDTLRRMFRKDYKFLRFYLLPFMNDFIPDVRWMSEQVGTSIQQAFEYQDLLMNAGYWIRNSSGGISAKENYLRFKNNFDSLLSAAEFLTLCTNISSRISNDGQCWFETFTITTTKDIQNDFIKNLNSLLKDFRQKSENSSGEIMISWSQIYTHALNGTNANEEIQ